MPAEEPGAQLGLSAHDTVLLIVIRLQSLMANSVTKSPLKYNMFKRVVIDFLVLLKDNNIMLDA